MKHNIHGAIDVTYAVFVTLLEPCAGILYMGTGVSGLFMSVDISLLILPCYHKVR